MPQYKKTTKLHYSKYLYKAVFYTNLAFSFSSYRNKGKDRLGLAQSTINDLDNDYINKRSLKVSVRRSQKDVSTIDYKGMKSLLEYLTASTGEWRVRVENSFILTVYTSDKTLIDSIETISTVREIYKPEEGMENFLLLNIGTAIVNSPSEYDYRVYLKGNKMDPSFGNWLEANQDKSKVGDVTLRNIKNGYYLSGNYFYVRNDKVLTIVRMLIGYNVRRVEKLIYKEDIDKYMYDNNK